MGFAAADDFNRPDGALGTATTGQPWAVLRGTVTVVNQRAVAGTASPGAIAVVDTSYASADITLGASIGSGYGQALYFRVDDASNWYRLVYRRYTNSFFNGTYTCQNCLNSGPCGPLEQSSVDSSGSYTDASGQPGYRSCSPNYSSETVYAFQLQRSIGGSLTTLLQSSVNAGLTFMKVVARGRAVQTFSSDAANASAVGSWTASDDVGRLATRHGLGYGETTNSSNTTGFDNFYATPDYIGNYLPPIYL